MPVKYSDIEWNEQPVVWYIVSRNMQLTSGTNVEQPSIHEADDEVQEMCDEVSTKFMRRYRGSERF